MVVIRCPQFSLVVPYRSRHDGCSISLSFPFFSAAVVSGWFRSLVDLIFDLVVGTDYLGTKFGRPYFYGHSFH